MGVTEVSVDLERICGTPVARSLEAVFMRESKWTYALVAAREGLRGEVSSEGGVTKLVERWLSAAAAAPTNTTPAIATRKGAEVRFDANPRVTGCRISMRSTFSAKSTGAAWVGQASADQVWPLWRSSGLIGDTPSRRGRLVPWFSRGIAGRGRSAS